MTTLPAGKENPRRSFFAGWAVSLTLHAALFFIVGITLRGCQQGSIGQAGGEVFRDVGLFVLEGLDDGEADTGLAPGSGDSKRHATCSGTVSPMQTRRTLLCLIDSKNRVPTEAPDITSLLNENPFDSTSTALMHLQNQHCRR